MTLELTEKIPYGSILDFFNDNTEHLPENLLSGEGFEYIIKDLVDNLSKEQYDRMISELESSIKEDVSNRRNMLYDDEQPVFSAGQLLSILVMTRVFNHNNIKLPEGILSGLHMTNPESFFNYYDELFNYFNSSDELIKDYNPSKIVSDIQDHLLIFSNANVLRQEGSTISIKDIIDLYKEVPELRELMEYSGGDEESDTVSAKNAVRDRNQARMKEIIMNDDHDNSYKEFLEAGSGININQLGEVVLQIGYKPNQYGTVISYPIYRSFLQGFNEIKQLFIDAIGARTALFTSKVQVRKSGYFNRKINSLTSDLKLDLRPDHEDCHTKHFVSYKVTSQKELDMINGRYIMVDDKPYLVNHNQDTDLIGQTVDLRSPITCAAEGNGICLTCYGELYKVNSFLDGDGKRHSMGIGTIGTLLLCEPFTQKLLSTKHLLRVEVDEVKLPDGFDKFATLSTNKISLINKPRAASLFIPADAMDENLDKQTDRFTTDRVVYKGTEYKFDYNLILNDDIADDLNKYYNTDKEAYEFVPNKVKKFDWLFKIVLHNNGIADPLMKIKNALEYNTFFNMYGHNFNDLLNYVVKNLVISKTHIQSVHVELVIRQMVKWGGRATTGFDRTVLATDDTLPKYELLNVTNDAILYGDSPVKSLLYQSIYKQFTTETYGLLNKRGESVLDSYLK